MSTKREVIVGGSDTIAVSSIHEGDSNVLLSNSMARLVEPSVAARGVPHNPELYARHLLIKGLLGSIAARTSALEVDSVARLWSSEVLGLYESGGEDSSNAYGPLMYSLDSGLTSIVQHVRAKKPTQEAALRAKYELQLGLARTPDDLGWLAVRYSKPAQFIDTIDVLHQAIAQDVPLDIYDQHPAVLRNATRAISYLKVNPTNRSKAMTDRLFGAVDEGAGTSAHRAVIVLARGVQPTLEDVPENEMVSPDNPDDYPRSVNFILERALIGLHPRNSQAALERVNRLKQVVLHTAQPPTVLK